MKCQVISMWVIIKGYLRYKTITSQNMSSDAFFYFIENICSVLKTQKCRYLKNKSLFFQGDEMSISWEDKRFLSLMDESAKRIGDQCELPLPFGNDSKMLNKDIRFKDSKD